MMKGLLNDKSKPPGRQSKSAYSLGGCALAIRLAFLCSPYLKAAVPEEIFRVRNISR